MDIDEFPTPRLAPGEALMIEQQGQLLLARMFGVGATPRRLGRYVLRDKLGEGGMGVVYEAYDTKLRRKVALKLLGVDHPELRRRFVREARAMARIDHPNALEIHEVDEFEDQAYLAMEYVDGVTLREWLATPHTSAEILEVFVAAGRGLAAAHRAGLVHRDFKPTNVMIDRAGMVRVMDFGVAQIQAEVVDEALALAQSHESRLTRPGALIGTPGYMSPEQACCEPTDARSDQFSFCVALYEALFGQRPFAVGGGGLPHFLDLPSRGPRRGRRPSDLPLAVERALLRGLRVAADERFASMDELLDALAMRPRRSIARVLEITSIAALGLGLVVAIGAVGRAWLHDQAELERTRIHVKLERPLARAEQRLEDLPIDTDADTPDALGRVADELSEGRVRVVLVGTPGQPLVSSATWQLDTRDAYLAWLARARTSAPFRIDHEGGLRWVVFRPVELPGRHQSWIGVVVPEVMLEPGGS